MDSSTKGVGSLVTDNVTSADIVFVPFCYHHWEPHNFNYLLGNATHLFPYLLEKPHIMVLSHPLSVHPAPATIQLLETSKLFHYITLNGDNTWGTGTADYTLNITISPHFWRQHWHDGMERYRDGGVNSELVLQQKQYLATGSWLQRDGGSQVGGIYNSRIVWKDQCIAMSTNSGQCKWVEWKENKHNTFSDLVLNVDRSIQESWYTLVPWGDFGTRGKL